MIVPFITCLESKIPFLTDSFSHSILFLFLVPSVFLPGSLYSLFLFLTLFSVNDSDTKNYRLLAFSQDYHSKNFAKLNFVKPNPATYYIS